MIGGSERRTVGGWAALAALGGLVVFYLVVARAILSPTVDETFRRTYVTAEFGVYPPSSFFEGRNGLAYDLGRRTDLTKSKDRLYLSRFDWLWQFRDAVSLDGLRGRLFVHLAPEARRPDLSHEVRLGFECRPRGDLVGRFTVRVNGTVIGGFDCAGPPGIRDLAFEAPAGVLGVADYEEVAIERQPEGLLDRVLTRLGDRLSMFGLAWFEIAPRPA